MLEENPCMWLSPSVGMNIHYITHNTAFSSYDFSSKVVEVLHLFVKSEQKNETHYYLCSPKVLKLRFKVDFRMSKHWSRALIWDIIHQCSPNTFGDRSKYMKITILKFLRFLKKLMNLLSKTVKITKRIYFIFSQTSNSSFPRKMYNISF